MLNILTRNKCEVLVLKPAFRDVERDILEDMYAVVKPELLNEYWDEFGNLEEPIHSTKRFCRHEF